MTNTRICGIRRLGAADDGRLVHGEIENRAGPGNQSRDRSGNLRTAGTDSADAYLSEQSGGHGDD